MAADSNRLVAVDGLRGIAAICVAVMHSHIAGLPVLRGYLAVDFFFILSGYVIARGYEPRFAGGLPVRQYALARVERLYPMLLIGGVIGVAAWLAGYSTFHAIDRRDLTLALVGQFSMVPYLSSANSVAFDAALWSISFELLANIIHAVIYPRLSTRRLVLLTGCAFLLLAFMGNRYGSLNIGCTHESAIGGLGRVLFGFFIGVLLWRTEGHWRPHLPRLPFAVIGLGLVLIANAPLVGHGLGIWSVLFDLGVVAVVFPLLVMLGVQASGAGRFALALGVLSFPIYAIHVPLVDAMRLAGWSSELRLAAIVPIAVAAWMLGRHVDEPLNAWRRAVRRQASAGGAAPQLRRSAA